MIPFVYTQTGQSPQIIMIQKEGWVCFYFCYMDVMGKVRGERPCKKPSPGRLPNNCVQGSLPPASICIQGKFVSMLEKSGDHKPQRRSRWKDQRTKSRRNSHWVEMSQEGGVTKGTEAADLYGPDVSAHRCSFRGQLLAAGSSSPQLLCTAQSLTSTQFGTPQRKSLMW